MQVARDLADRLTLSNPSTITLSMDRPELWYEVCLCDALPESRPALADLLGRLRGANKDQSGLVYCPTREKCDALADTLRDAGLSALAYAAQRGKISHDQRLAWRWECAVRGPPGSPYAGEHYRVVVRLPLGYPAVAPKVDLQ